MRAANFGRFYLNRFCCEENNLHVPHNKIDSLLAAGKTADKSGDLNFAGFIYQNLY